MKARRAAVAWMPISPAIRRDVKGWFMQRFNTAYITYYNLRHHRSGHLYQGRYKAILVEADKYWN